MRAMTGAAMRAAKKATNFEAKASRWLADANEASEKGQKAKAERLYEKAQYWLDKANIARGWA
jgi:hypothetical protein